MEYFVTGATGFIGKRLVKKLLARRGSTVHFLVRPESRDKVPALLDYWNTTETRAKPVFGDLSQSMLGVSRARSRRSPARSITSSIWPRCMT
jgi:thioester reductase-like protein